jgi:radical SAM superfamily enzyme YgiQ (UPF0313 family)
VAAGEGEGILLDVANGRPRSEIGGLCYREGERVVCNPRRPRIPDLDSLPFPAYEKLAGFPSGYYLPLFSSIRRLGATVVTSRGCPFACSFCDRSVFWREHRAHSPGYIHEHLRWLRKRFRIGHINFYDDLFAARRESVLGLCELLVREPLGLHFNCALRPGQADRTLLRALKRAGCLQISLGVESGSPALLARHKSGVRLEEVRDLVADARALDLRVKGLFIFGLPGETPETARQTSDYIQELGFDEINLSKFSPFPGSPLWNECVSGVSGEFLEDWRRLNCVQSAFRPAGFASFREMDEVYRRSIRRFYRGGGFQARWLRRVWQHRWSILRALRSLPDCLGAARHYCWRNSPPPDRLLPHPCQPFRIEIPSRAATGARNPVRRLQPESL